MDMIEKVKKDKNNIKGQWCSIFPKECPTNCNGVNCVQKKLL